MAVTEIETMKQELEQSYQTLKNHPATFPQSKPSLMETRVQAYELSPNLIGALSFVAQEQNHIVSSLPEQCINHFKPFEFPPDELFGSSSHPCARPDQVKGHDPVKGMIHIYKGDEKVARFDFLRTSCTFDLSGLSLYIETPCRACNDVQIVLNDARIDVLALSEETHARENADMNGSHACYLLRHFSRTFHLPHAIAHKEASVRQESNGMCVYIPWK